MAGYESYEYMTSNLSENRHVAIRFIPDCIKNERHANIFGHAIKAENAQAAPEFCCNSPNGSLRRTTTPRGGKISAATTQTVHWEDQQHPEAGKYLLQQPKRFTEKTNNTQRWENICCNSPNSPRRKPATPRGGKNIWYNSYNGSLRNQQHPDVWKHSTTLTVQLNWAKNITGVTTFSDLTFQHQTALHLFLNSISPLPNQFHNSVLASSQHLRQFLTSIHIRVVWTLPASYPSSS